MKRQNGALRVFLYNWPVYVGTWSVALLVVLIASPRSGLAANLVGLAALGACAWSLVSLLVSYYIYDRSPLLSGAWVPGLFGASARTWAAVHAGLDAEVDLETAMPGTCVAQLDIFERGIMSAPSIARARSLTPSKSVAIPCKATGLALDDACCDAIVVAFTAHEIRDRAARDGFFAELRRCVRPGGRVLLVEHLRDLPNFCAFGLGFLHFMPKKEWLRLASQAGFTVASETRVTPWVMALTLERSA